MTTGIHGYCASTRYSSEYSLNKDKDYGQRPDFADTIPIDPSENIFPLDNFFAKHNFKFMDGTACTELLKTEENIWKKTKNVTYDCLLATMYSDMMDIKNCYHVPESVGEYVSICCDTWGLYRIMETGTGVLDAFFYRIGSYSYTVTSTFDF